MPLPTLVFLTLGTGILAALLGAAELRLSPRPALLSTSFQAFALFLVLLVLPVSVYFYVFHGDWFLLYSIDVRRVPSAVALLGFVAELGLGVLGFWAGNQLARAQRMGLGYALSGCCLVAALGVLVLFRDRLRAVGTYAQFRGDFGLEPYGGPLMQAGIVMGVLLAGGIAFLLARIGATRRRV